MTVAIEIAVNVLLVYVMALNQLAKAVQGQIISANCLLRDIAEAIL